MNTSSLVRSSGKAALWQILGGGWQTLVRLGASVFLARALKPSDFGLFGMALLFRDLLVHIGAMGMASGIIVKKNVSQEDLNTCFWTMAAVRCCLFLIAFLGAPLVALFFKESRVVPVIQIVAFCFIIQIFSIIPNTLLIKELRFKSLNLINGIGVFLESSLAVFLAINTDLAYWSLVIALLVSNLFINLAIFASAIWWPRFNFNKESFNYLFRFGIHGLFFSIISYLRQNLDYLLVGRLLGSYQLGLYEFAYRIPHLVFDRISRPVGSVVFPALSKVQDDNNKIFTGYVKSVKFVTFIAFPMLFGLAAVADILVPVFWGEQWLSIIKPLQILCLCAALRCIFQPIGSIFYCKNRPDLQSKIAFINLIFTAISISILGYFYGLIGVALGMLVSCLPSFIILWYAFHVLLEKNFFMLFKELWPIIFSSLMCLFGTFWVKKLCLIFHLNIQIVSLITIFSGAIIYVICIFILFNSLIKEIFKNIGLIL
ncbi:lipopolysaccharide biosynthesis protein [Desulfothermus naphthae]